MDYDFFDKREYLENVANVLNKAYDKYKQNDGNIIRVSISLCPNAGKSYITTLFTAWCLGKDYDERILRTSHTRDLVVDHSRDVKNIIKGDKHSKVFNKKFNFTKDSEGKWGILGSKFDINYNIGSVSSGIQGKRASIGITDDTIAKTEDALNDTYLDNLINRFYENDFTSRLLPNALEIHIGTRWRERDIIGYIKEQGLLDYEISLPALINKKSFCEYVVSTKELLKKQQTQSLFDAMYQQDPLDNSDLILFKKEELNWFTDNQVNRNSNGTIKSTKRFARLDLADKGDDFTALIFADVIFDNNKISNDNIKIIFDDKIIYTNEKYELYKDKMISMCLFQKPAILFIESNFGGSMIAVEFRNVLQKYGIKVIDRPTIKNKEVKIDMCSLMIKNYCYFKSDATSRDYEYFLKHILSYKRMIKNQKDDGLDVIAEIKDDIQRDFSAYKIML